MSTRPDELPPTRSSDQAGNSLRTFVRSAWVLLAFQLAAAALALAVTGWAALKVRPLLEQRDRLAKEIVDFEKRVTELAEAEQALVKSVAKLRMELQGARASTPVLTEAIRAFHAKDYARAIVKYDEALELNPGDAYIHNLKSYSQFKAGDAHGAAETLSRALELNPTYDWGYFDLARYQCAAGSPQAALRTINGALEKRGEKIRDDLNFFLTQDGEFDRLCRNIRSELRGLAVSPRR
jgi:tetratricopeptide (TPR) repeat protein